MFRYREHVVWTDKDTNLKLLRKGVLTRIYAPMVSSNLNLVIFQLVEVVSYCCYIYAQCLQAIIRGLKESGVFTSAVTSAKAESSNMGLENKGSIQLNVTAGQSTLEGGHGKLQATVRKILEMVDAQEEAMPPMSPPGFLELTENATALS